MKIYRWPAYIFDHIIDRAADFGDFLCGAVMLLVVGAVIARYGLHMSQAWVIEVTEYCLLYITFLGVAWVLKVDKHVKMDVLVSQMAPRTRAVIDIIISTICAMITGLLIWFGIDTIRMSIERGLSYTAGMRPPMIIFLWVILFGFSTLFIQFARRIYRLVNTLKTGGAAATDVQREK